MNPPIPEPSCYGAFQRDRPPSIQNSSHHAWLFVSRLKKNLVKGNLFTTSFALASLIGIPLASGQTTQNSSGTATSFSVNASSTFTVNTSVTSSPGVKASAEANAILKENLLKTGVDCNGTNCSATFKTTGDTQDINVKGASSSQQIVLDPSSVFKTSVDTSAGTSADNQNSGNASAGFTANSTLTVTKQETNFTNTIITAF